MTASHQPLAARMRPATLDDIVGQDHLIYPGSPLELLVSDQIASPSVLLYGNPSSGKTSLAHIVAKTTKKRFVELSATSAGVKDVRAAIAAAEASLQEDPPIGTVLFIDEVHRFSKSQQDILLPAVEAGTVSLIGATTENPSFSVNSALRSRAILLQLNPLTAEAITTLINRALTDERGLPGYSITDEAAAALARAVDGDARQALTLLELCAGAAKAASRTEITEEDVSAAAPAALLRYDADGDQHYDIVSAFIKSIRSSDPDAALHWMARMLASGEDPRFVSRRLMVHASEDIGMADPIALLVATAAHQAVSHVGMPEARLILGQATVHLATARKSNATYAAVNAAFADVEAGRTGAVPKPLRDAHYPGAKALGHGIGYLYAHDYPYGVSPAQQCGPEGVDFEITGRYYQPTTHGGEDYVTKTMNAAASLRTPPTESEHR